MSLETVTVACKLPNGLAADLYAPDGSRHRVNLNGARLPVDEKGREKRTHVVFGDFGLTPGVSREWWDAWSKANAHYPPVRNGLIFAHVARDNVEAQADASVTLRTGLEGMDPDKPAPGVTKADDKG